VSNNSAAKQVPPSIELRVEMTMIRKKEKIPDLSIKNSKDNFFR